MWEVMSRTYSTDWSSLALTEGSESHISSNCSVTSLFSPPSDGILTLNAQAPTTMSTVARQPNS